MTKIIVSHFAKQHVNALLDALNTEGVSLQRFYTSIAGNKLAFLSKRHLKLKKLLDKKQFSAANDTIKHIPLLGLATTFFKTEYTQVRYLYQNYDKWVAYNIQKEDFDIIIGYETCNLYTFKTAKKLGKTTILDLASVHHNLQNDCFMQAGIERNPEQLAYISDIKEQALAYTDYVFCLSKLARKSLIDNGFYPNLIYTLNLGINHQLFTPKKVYNTEGTKPLQLYFVGRMTRGKGLDFLMQVLQKLIDKGKKIHLTLIGGEDDFTPPLSISAHITRIPFITHAELVQLHHRFDLFVYPSVLESWGMAATEAMACGSPILISDKAGAKDAVEKGGGEILPFGDIEAWVLAIEKYYDNRYLLENIGKQAAHIAQSYTWEAYHNQVLKAIKDIEISKTTKKFSTVNAL
jgi:glycosyltransferase involved in cell wall biosynthesis